jgi:hypothetical protein
MTIEDIENNGEFRFTKKLLMRKFPFIKDLKVDQENMGKYSTLIPTIITIDLSKFMETFDIHRLEKYAMKGTDKYYASDLEWLVTREGTLNARAMDEKIKQIVNDTHYSPAIPDNYRLGKELFISRIYVDKDSIPQDIMD